MVMIDRTFNQEERSNLTQDKRMVLVDPGINKNRRVMAFVLLPGFLERFLFCFADSFLEDFCCGTKSKLFQDPAPSQSLSNCSFSQPDRSSTEPPYRTDSQAGYGDPGGGGAIRTGAADKLPPPQIESRIVLGLKRSQQHYRPTSNSSCTAANTYPQGNRSPFAATSGGQAPSQVSHHLSSQQTHYPPQLTSLSHSDTDSALEAAVNSILEC